jgi:hypothetical protein
VKLLEPWAAVLVLLRRNDEVRALLAELRSRGPLSMELVSLCREEGMEIPSGERHEI